MRKKLQKQNTKEKRITFAVQPVNGLFRKTQNCLRKNNGIRGGKMKVQILTTPGCSSCARVEKMLDEMKVKYEVIDITKNPKILEKYPIMTSPGIVINGELVFTGVPSKKELESELKKPK